MKKRLLEMTFLVVCSVFSPSFLNGSLPDEPPSIVIEESFNFNFIYQEKSCDS